MSLMGIGPLLVPGMGRSCQALPQNLLTTQHTLIEDFEVLGDFSVVGAAVADTTHFLHGTQSIQVTSPVGAQGYINKIYSPTLDFSTVDCIRVYFYVPDKTLIAGGTLLMSHSAGNYTNGFQVTLGTGSMRNGWNFKNIPRADWGTMGAGTWASPIAQIRFRMTSAGGVQAIASWDMMTAGVVGLPAVCIAFDDNYDSVYTLAYPIMRIHNIRGTAFTISSTVGAGGRMTIAQLTELYGAGWDIGNHSDTSTDLTTLSQAQAQTAIETCKSYLEGQDWTRAASHLAWPNGKFNDTTKAAAVAAGILTARTTQAGGSGYAILPAEDLWALNPGAALLSTQSLASIEGKIDTSIAKGGILLVYGHEIVPSGASGTQWNVADLAALVEYIAARKTQIACITASELYRLTLGSVPVLRMK